MLSMYLVSNMYNFIHCTLQIHRSDDILSEAVWSQHGDVRNAWKEAAISLDHEDKPYQVC